jgi:hypothetical protein
VWVLSASTALVKVVSSVGAINARIFDWFGAQRDIKNVAICVDVQ